MDYRMFCEVRGYYVSCVSLSFFSCFDIAGFGGCVNEIKLFLFISLIKCFAKRVNSQCFPVLFFSLVYVLFKLKTARRKRDTNLSLARPQRLQIKHYSRNFHLS